MRQEEVIEPAALEGRSPRRPAITRICFHLNWLFLTFWILYLLGPDVLGVWPPTTEGAAYRSFNAVFFLLHFALVSTAIIALFVVIIEVYARRPVRGFPSVVLGLALPIASFLYFAVRYLAEVGRWLERWR